jgi:hypothetical protein
MTKWVSRTAITVGCWLLGVSAALYVVMGHAVTAEQALSPGEDSFGVAVLGMTYGPGILATALGGLVSLVIGMTVLVFQRLQDPN